MYLSLSVPTFQFFFFFGRGWGGGGKARGEDLIDTASPVVAVLTLHVHACLRVGMFDCGLESYKQTNHMLAISIMLLITILTSFFHLSVLKSNSVVTVIKKYRVNNFQKVESYIHKQNGCYM